MFFPLRSRKRQEKTLPSVFWLETRIWYSKHSWRSYDHTGHDESWGKVGKLVTLFAQNVEVLFVFFKYSSTVSLSIPSYLLLSLPTLHIKKSFSYFKKKTTYFKKKFLGRVIRKRFLLGFLKNQNKKYFLKKIWTTRNFFLLSQK